MTLPKRPLRRKSYRTATAQSKPDPKIAYSSRGSDGHPVPISELLQSGLSCHQSGQLRSAIDWYQQVLSREPHNTEALHLLGVIAHQQGQHDTAIDLIRSAIRLEPNVANYHLNLGCALQALTGQDDHEEAVCCFETALRIDNQLVLAHNNLANALRKQGRFDKALEHFNFALRSEPNQLQVLNNLASLWIELGDLEQAESVLTTALQIDPEFPEASCNLALIEARRGASAKAISLYQKGLSRQPSLLSGWNNLGQLLAEQGAIPEATAAFDQAAKLAPKSFRKLKARTVCPVIPQSLEQIETYRTQLADQIKHFLESDLEIGPREWQNSSLNPPFHLPYHGFDDLQLKSGWAQMFEKQFPRQELPRREGQPHVGFVVADRHVPVFWKFVGGYLQHLPSCELKVSVIGSRSSLRELSKHPVSPQIETLAIPHALGEAARVLGRAGFDALYFFEPDADAFNYFLTFQGLAPLQCTSWGIPVTSGIPTMTDFLSCDWIEPADGQRHYRESLTKLNRLPTYYHRPTGFESRTREFFGFRENERLYGCPHSLFKFHPAFDPVLASILRRDDNAKIVLVEGRHTYWTSLLKQRWAACMPDIAHRIHFLPQQSPSDFRALLEICDVLLDPFPFGGGATTYDAMFVGTPTVTLPGQFMRGRVTLGCWKQMGIEDCIATDIEDYVAKSIQIASEPDLWEALKQRILFANELLFEDPSAVLELREWFLERIMAARIGS